MIIRPKRITSVILAMVMVLGAFIPSTDFAYAGTKRPAKVTGVKIIAKANKLTVKWKKEKRAKKYQVYVKRNSGKWKKVKTLRKTRFTYKAKKDGTFSFKVRALNGKKKGRFSKVRKVEVKEKAPEPENKKFALDCPSEINVNRNEEFTLKVKGESNIIKYTIWDYDKTYLKMTSYNSQGPSVSFTPHCTGTTKVIADSQEGIKYTITINVERQAEICEAEISVINPYGYKNTFYQPWAPYVGHQAIYIKTSADESKFKTFIFKEPDSIEVGDTVYIPEAWSGEPTKNPGTTKSCKFNIPKDAYINRNNRFDDIVYYDENSPKVKGGYVYDFIVYESEGAGTYHIAVYDEESHEVVAVSSGIDVVDTSYSLQSIKRNILAQVKPGMTETEKYNSMFNYVHNYLRYPYYYKSGYKTTMPAFTDGRSGWDLKDPYEAASVMRCENHTYAVLSTEAMRDRRIYGIGDSNDFWQTFADCCEENGMVVTQRKIHAVKVIVDGEELTCNPCPGYLIGSIDCTKLDTIQELYG